MGVKESSAADVVTDVTDKFSGKTEGGRQKRQEDRGKRRKGRGKEKFFLLLPIFISHC